MHILDKVIWFSCFRMLQNTLLPIIYRFQCTTVCTNVVFWFEQLLSQYSIYERITIYRTSTNQNASHIINPSASNNTQSFRGKNHSFHPPQKVLQLCPKLTSFCSCFRLPPIFQFFFLIHWLCAFWKQKFTHKNPLFIYYLYIILYPVIRSG